ncbi:unnamed protein product [Mycetohabitans rhizoxinica HKI 454]|uniref:Uncharacterized protein n=1 Tax=Mycetohabitans rhizoxinica (strain DSM 19002 / CIP 109453 / HKI 454) TaxID=882378 RepID=E5AQ90_MYCRK|nr:unnamed protein product [Mycetohabitans rhizoxinica HKI 454]
MPSATTLRGSAWTLAVADAIDPACRYPTAPPT